VYHRIIIGAALALLLNGCAHDGYARADELQDNERGPRECAASCEQLGMYMSAFVLVDRGTSGCVCSPNPGTQAPRAELDATGPAAAYAMLEAQRQAQQRQQQQVSGPKP
jgi:hypothetical protein